MKLSERADMYLLSLFVIGIIFAIFVHEWHETTRNHVTVVNDSKITTWINVNCVPKDLCHFWMHQDETHQYNNIQSLEFSYEQNNLRHYFTVTIPEEGNFTIHLAPLFTGKVPEKLSLTCATADHKDDYQKHTTVPCPTPPAEAP